MPEIIDHTGERFGKWTVLRQGSGQVLGAKRIRVRTTWICRCDCGNERDIIIHKRSNSCSSCANSLRKSKHRMAKSREYSRWRGIKARCFKTVHRYYCNYGGRGITMFTPWVDDFARWHADVLAEIGPWPGKGYTLDRWPNPDGNYEPGNIRWATAAQQGANRGRKTNKIKVVRRTTT